MTRPHAPGEGCVAADSAGPRRWADAAGIFVQQALLQVRQTQAHKAAAAAEARKSQQVDRAQQTGRPARCRQAQAAHRAGQLVQQVAQRLLRQRQVAHGPPLVLRDEHLRRVGTEWAQRGAQRQANAMCRPPGTGCAAPSAAGHTQRKTPCWANGTAGGQPARLYHLTHLQAQDAGGCSQHKHCADQAGQGDEGHGKHLAAGRRPVGLRAQEQLLKPEGCRQAARRACDTAVLPVTGATFV